jgi:signal transduction histidine kinase
MKHISPKQLLPIQLSIQVFSASPIPQHWKNFTHSLWHQRTLRFKLACLLLIGTALPMSCLIYLFRWSSEQQMLHGLEEELIRDSKALISTVRELEVAHQNTAAYLARSLESGEQFQQEGRLQDSETVRSLLQGNQKDANLAIVTDETGKIISHVIQASAADHTTESQPLLPSPNHPGNAPDYYPVGIQTDTFMGDVPILQSVFSQRRPLTGTELLSSDVLQRLGLAKQAEVGLRPQPTQNLSIAKQPAPAGTYEIEQGKIGLMVTAVYPIRHRQRMVGAVMLGTLLNRNYQIVDSVRYRLNVPVATIFAQDLRISTNVPFRDQQTRAIGTRAAQEVSEKVLQQQQVFSGWTNIVGVPHLTRYSPIYNHQKQINPAQAKPVGMLFVGQMEAEVRQMVEAHQNAGILVGIGFVGLAGLLAIPLAASLTKPIQRLAVLSQAVTDDRDLNNDPAKDQTELADRLTMIAQQLNTEFDVTASDEVNVLAAALHRLLDSVADRTQQLTQGHQKISLANENLLETLEELKVAQSQLIQSEKMSGLGQMVAGVAHEINNPVSFIYGNVNHVQEYVGDLLALIELYHQETQPTTVILEREAAIDLEFVRSDLPKTLSSMRVGASRIKEIVLSLRNFSRKDEADYKAVNLHDGIDSTLLILNHRLSGVEVGKEYGEIPLVPCYPAQLNQVFMNILSNAVDAMTATDVPTPRIRITTQIVDETVQVQIADNGPGVPLEVRSKLFDPFFTTKPVGQGTGLGLSICYQIMEKHQGTITVMDTVDDGAIFVMTLPLLPTHSEFI